MTGATGYIGSRLLRELEAGGYTVFAPGGASPTPSADRIECAVASRGALNRIATTVLRPLLTVAFAHRHPVVRAAGRARPRVAARLAAVVALVAATTPQPAAAQAQRPPTVRAVPFVDLDRYAGDWFEIARFPNRFQRQCVGDVRATYSRRADARVEVVNHCRNAEGQTDARGVARIVDDRTFAKLKVRFASCVAVVAPDGLGRLLDYRPCARLFLGGRRRPRPRLPLDPRPRAPP